MERLTKYVNGVVWYDYKGNKYPAYDMDNSDMLHALNRLAQLEDEAEQREQGCQHCTTGCGQCWNKDFCDEPNPNKPKECELYSPTNYCRNCGRKLVGK